MSDKPWLKQRKPRVRFLNLTLGAQWNGHAEEVASESLDVELTPEQRAQAQAIAKELALAYKREIDYYRRCLDNLRPDDAYREKLTPEYIHDQATHPADESVVERIAGTPMPEITWSDLQSLLNAQPELAMEAWNVIIQGAGEYIDSGRFAAENAGTSVRRPWERALFTLLRNDFQNAWEPRNAIEAAMVDMLLQNYWGFQWWNKAAMQISENYHNAIENEDGDRRWRPPSISASTALQESMQMIERFNRLFMRTLRQMRDLRRYPITIANAGQVNIAADGGQQVNVQKSKESKKRTKKGAVTTGKGKARSKAATKSEPKQIAPILSEESNRMKSVSGARPAELQRAGDDQ